MVIDREQLFGIDLQLAERVGGFDLMPDFRQDLDLAQGSENIIQALPLRLLVRQGELTRLGYPSYGSRLHELIGEPNNARTHLKLMAYARSAIEQDPRVKKLQDIRTEVIPGERDTVRLLMEIELIDLPEPVQFLFNFNLQSP